MYIFQDVKCNVCFKIKFILILYRVGNRLYKNEKKISKILFILYLIPYRVLVEWVLGVEIPLKTTIGNRLTVYHGVGLVINPQTVIGNDVTLRNGVVIGNKAANSGSPIVGNNVQFGANAIALGPITIGDNVTLGAGVVVTKSIDEDSTVVCSPFREL